MAKRNIQETTIEALVPDQNNFNRHTEYGMGLLQKSVQKHGLGRSILIDRNNRIMAGNGITETAAALGLSKVITIDVTGDEIVAVRRTDMDLLTPEGQEMALADNATGQANLSWDKEAIAKAQREFNLPVQEWGVPDFAMPAKEEKELTEDNFKGPKNVKTKIKAGDLFEIHKGNRIHRILCGDSTRPEDVRRLMGERQADLVVTDPPYNVDYASKNELLNLVDKGNRIQTDIEGDRMEDADFRAFLEASFANMAEAARPGAAIYCFHASREAVNFIQALTGAGFSYRQQLVWVKNNIVLGRQDYQWSHEPILYGWKEGGPHYFIAERSNRTVFEDRYDLDAMSKKELLELARELLNDALHPTTVLHENKPLVNAEHPTMKPVTLVGRFVRNSSREEELVLDPFLGSGSTLVACHQLERDCYGIEISPEYCQTAIDRLKAFDPEVTVEKI